MNLATYHTGESVRELSHDNNRGPEIEALAKQQLAHDCPYSFYFRDVSIDFADDTLTLRGRVPSFYMKQILQTLLARVDGVNRVDNQVDVTSATGLSSVRPRDVGFRSAR